MGSAMSIPATDNQTRDGLRRPLRVSGDVALRINQAVKFRRLGGINRDSDQVGAGRDGDGAPIVRVPADAVGKVVGLRQQTPAYVIRRPGQGEICPAHLGDDVGRRGVDGDAGVGDGDVGRRRTDRAAAVIRHLREQRVNTSRRARLGELIRRRGGLAEQRSAVVELNIPDGVTIRRDGSCEQDI